jgi:hypothetical protein
MPQFINGKLVRRKDKNFFTKLSISDTSFIGSQRANWDFASVGIALLVESNNQNEVVQYSFNGTDVHGDLTPRTPSEGIIFDNRIENSVWFRRVIPGSAITVRIEAWRHEA